MEQYTGCSDIPTLSLIGLSMEDMIAIPWSHPPLQHHPPLLGHPSPAHMRLFVHLFLHSSLLSKRSKNKETWVCPQNRAQCPTPKSTQDTFCMRK